MKKAQIKYMKKIKIYFTKVLHFELQFTNQINTTKILEKKSFF